MVLAEKNLPYQLIEVDLKNKPPDLLRLNPYGKVPVLVDGEAVIYESAIINEYLEEKYAQVSLLPKDFYLRAQARIWIDFCNTRIHAATHEISRGKDPDSARQKLNEHFAALEQALAAQDYLIGTYSLADVTFIPVFTRLARYGATLDESFARVRGWSERLLERPAVRTTLIPPQPAPVVAA